MTRSGSTKGPNCRHSQSQTGTHPTPRLWSCCQMCPRSWEGALAQPQKAGDPPYPEVLHPSVKAGSSLKWNRIIVFEERKISSIINEAMVLISLWLREGGNNLEIVKEMTKIFPTTSSRPYNSMGPPRRRRPRRRRRGLSRNLASAPDAAQSALSATPGWGSGPANPHAPKGGTCPYGNGSRGRWSAAGLSQRTVSCWTVLYRTVPCRAVPGHRPPEKARGTPLFIPAHRRHFALKKQWLLSRRTWTLRWSGYLSCPSSVFCWWHVF